MNPIAALGLGLATVAASLALAAPAAATTGTCTVTAQPWDGRSYALTAVVDGSPQALITKQSGMLEGQTSWTFTAPSGVVGDLTGVTEVWWAARNPAKQSTAADFYDVLHVNPDCRFATPYKADPGHQDSVVIRTATHPTPTLPIETTTTAAPTTTSTAPVTTTSTVLEPTTSTTRPAPTTTFQITPSIPDSTTTTAPQEVTTTTTQIVVDVPLTPPTATTAPTPEVPSSTVELYTATSVEAAKPAAGSLPHTGINNLTRFAWGVGLMAAGLILAIGSRACRRLNKDNAR